MKDKKDIVYRINNQDELVFVNEEWDQFAAANAGEAVVSSQVLNRPLWDFIVDSTTRELYQQVLKQTRDGRSFRFAFRCDSPTRRRLLEMNVNRVEPDTIEFRTRSLSEENRAPVVLPESDETESTELLRTCAWCKKIFVSGGWLEIEEAVARLQLFHRPLLPYMTHGICEGCYQEMARILDDE